METCRNVRVAPFDSIVISSPRMRTFTVHDAIEAAGFGKFQIILSIIGGLSWMADSMEVMLLSLLTPSLVCEWGISPFEQALGITCVFLGWMVSSPFWGSICDTFGRKTGLISASLMAFVVGVGTAFTPSFWSFLIVRCLVGFAVGGVPQSVTICSEFLPIKIRAKCLVILKFFWAIGAAVEAGLAVVVMPTLGWRWLVGLSSLPLALFTLSCWWLPESARFLVAKGRLEEAERTLQRVARYNGTSLPEGRLTAEYLPEYSDDEPKRRDGFLQLLNKRHRRSTLQIWFIWVVLAFLYYGITLYTTKLFQSGDICHGGTVINNTSSSLNNTDSLDSDLINSNCKLLRTDDYVDIMTTAFSELPGLIVTLIIIETLGRRPTFFIEFLIFGLAATSLFFCMDRLTIVIILFVARALMAGAFQCAYIYTTEVYPTTLRASGLGTAGGMARIGAMITPLFAQVLSSQSLSAPALVYGVVGFAGAITSALLPIETKGRAMQDVVR